MELKSRCTSPVRITPPEGSVVAVTSSGQIVLFVGFCGKAAERDVSAPVASVNKLCCSSCGPLAEDLVCCQ